MPKFEYTQEEVDKVSRFLQNHMAKAGIKYLTADEASDLLAKNSILKNDIGPKSGFNFREMLRQGRDGKIKKVTGAYQLLPGSRWKVNLIEK
jgi:hypothetical protein